MVSNELIYKIDLDSISFDDNNLSDDMKESTPHLKKLKRVDSNIPQLSKNVSISHVNSNERPMKLEYIAPVEQ